MTISQTNPGQILPGEERDRIIRIGPARRHEAIARLVGSPGDIAAAERFLAYAGSNAIRLDGLWGRLDADGAIAHTALCIPSAGRTCMVFTSRPGPRSQVTPLAGLIDHACRQVEEWPVDLAQALLETSARLERRAFLDADFFELATLSYLERPLARATLPPRPVWPHGVETQPYRDELSGDLELALEASYIDTLDCPGLYGLRRTADIIAGHRATGVFEAPLWTLLRLDGKPAGAVLLNPFPTHKTVELVYLGLVPEARGRGLGRQLLRHALWLLAPRHEHTLTLAVDDRNTPAQAIYRAEDMRRVLQRIALIRPFRAPGEPRH